MINILPHALYCLCFVIVIALLTMKFLLVFAASIMSLFLAPGKCKEINVNCPGQNTLEIEYCALRKRDESRLYLYKKYKKHVLQQWFDTSRLVCEQAYKLYREGSIYNQMVIGCEDRLNKALLIELRGLAMPPVNSD